VIEILKAPPYATVQDLGFPSGRAWGLPICGAMDPVLLRAANAMAGNPPGAAALEWALGPLTVQSDREVRIAAIRMTEIRVGARAVALPPAGMTVPARVPVTLVPVPGVVFSYLAVAGGIAAPMVLGSRSTYLAGGFGGWGGRRLQRGDRLAVGSPSPATGDPVLPSITVGDIPLPQSGDADPPGYPAAVLRVVRGPQWDRFDPAAREGFFSAQYTVDRASDRSGYRLSGPAVLPKEPATLPSEPACPGAVQVPDNGQPIVLMPDGPTVGGYPKLAVVIRSDLRLLAQCHPGRVVRFREVSLEEAREAGRAPG